MTAAKGSGVMEKEAKFDGSVSGVLIAGRFWLG